jgi:hypothetical protein
VEAALVMVIAVFCLIGIVDAGQVLVMHQGIAERVRTGARWGVVNAYDPVLIKNVVLYNTPNPAGGAKPLLNMTPSNVAVSWLNQGQPESRIVVSVQGYTIRFFTPFIRRNYVARTIRVSMPVEEI